MIREVKLLCARDVSTASSFVQPATSPYGWLGTGSITVHDAWNTVDSGGDTDGTFAYCWPTNGGEEHLVGFDPGPTLALFEKVTFTFGADYSKTGPNLWWFPPDNSFGPRVKPVLIGRDGTTRHYGSYYEFDPGAEDNFVNISTDPSIYRLHTVSWELTSHPEGGPFTLSDINTLVAGVAFDTSNGPNGKPYETIGGFFKIRVPWFTCVLTIQDLGGYVRAVRNGASTTLRLFRKARNTISLATPAHRATHEIGETVNVAHRRGPDSAGEGWGERALDRRSAFITQRTFKPEALQVVDECYDLYGFSCSLWGAFRIPIPWTPELSGIAWLDAGGEWTMSRPQDSWSLRPGDGVALRVLEDYPCLSEDGLALHIGGPVELALYNSNLENAAWTSAGVTGGLVFSTTDDLFMADELGYRTSVLATFGGSPGSGHKTQSVSLTAGDTVSVRARVRNVSVDDPVGKFLEVAFVGPTGDYWDEDGRAWTAVPTHIPIPSSDGFGEVILDQVPAVATGAHAVKIGRFSAAINTCSFVIGLVSVQKNADGCGTPLVTLGSTIARVADSFVVNNASPYTVWHRGRGMVIAEFRPFWRAEDLTAATEKTIVRASHSAGAFDDLRFVSGPTDYFTAERSDSGGSQTISIAVMTPLLANLRLTRDYYARVWFRWLGADGWREFAPYQAAIGYALYESDGTFVSYHEATALWTAPDGAVPATVNLGGLDGWLRWIEVKRNPLSGTEAVWRR
jgi:hypothetical protein